MNGPTKIFGTHEPASADRLRGTDEWTKRPAVPQYGSIEQDAKIVALERAVKNLTEILLVVVTVGGSAPLYEVLSEMVEKGIDFEDELSFEHS